MSVINSIAPIGWNKWSYARNFFEGVQIPDAPFPYLYTPSTGIWSASILDHCLIPWINVPGAFDTFLLAGGTTGTILGSISGLAAVAETFAISVHGQIFGVGRGAVPPQMGYCIGNKFKQHVYTRMDVQNDGMGHTITTNTSIELLQNSRFKRAFVRYGNIVGYEVKTIDGDIEYILTLDIEKDTPPPSTYLSGNKITITKQSSGIAITVDILNIKSNWDIVISKPSTDISLGDYYELNTIWYLEDPYLLSGFWMGTENEASVPNHASSGLNLYVTTHNSPYEEGKFLGVYIWMLSPESLANASSEVTTSIIPFIPPQPSFGSSMDDQGGYTWAFGGFGNSNEYPVYPNDIRYKVVKLDSPDIDGATIKYETRSTTTYQDYREFLSSRPTYMRVEIGTGGYIDRHNWYSPCLKNSYLKTNGKLYRIISHVAFNIIDVDCISSDGLSFFDPMQNQEYSIINQYAWFINEHYDGRISTGNNTGIFRGIIDNISSDKLEFTIQTLGDTFISTYKSYGLSFVDRYKGNVSLPLGFQNLFNKFGGWKLVNNNKEYDIDYINFSSASNETYTPYPIIVKLKESSSVITVNSDAYIAFDSTYDVYGSFSKESGFSLNLNVSAGLQGQTSGFIVSNTLCLSGEYVSNPYKIDIANGDMIGFTDGYLFGLAANGSAQSRYSQTMFFTVPRSTIGLSSLFHTIREEDWIIYKDVLTSNVTIRKGSLDFKEYPSKDEVVMGLPTLIESPQVLNGNQIVLNSAQERLRRLSFGVVDFQKGTSPVLSFGIGSYDSIYGFLISGQGKVDLQATRIQGFAPGTIPSNTYTDSSGNIVSPVYIYKRSTFQNLKGLYVDIGVDTESNIFIRDGSVSSALAQYVYDNQVLKNVNLVDVIRLPDGESIIFYGKKAESFNLYNEDKSGYKLNNSRSNNTLWFDSSAIFMLGSFSDAYYWGTPSKAKYGDDPEYVYPLMLLNSTEYLGCLYDPLSGYINIFVRAYRGSTSYLGSLRVSIQTLTHTIYECRGLNYNSQSPSTMTSTIFYRPQLLSSDFIYDSSKSWIHGDNDIIQNYFNLANSTKPLINDQYINILGSGCQVNHGGEFGIISSFIMDDGTYVVCYDSEVGVKSLYSSNQGLSWVGSNLVLARQGRCGFVVDGLLFYVTVDGIVMKQLESTDFSDIKSLAMQNLAGNSITSEEIKKQSYLDSAKTILLGSGIIEYQRLSGYITPQGTIKIFFYDNDNKLKGMESSNRSTWIVSDNF